MPMRILYAILTMTLMTAGSLSASAQNLENGIELYDAYKYTEAERALSQVTEAEPENAQAHEYLGLALLGAGNVDAAESALNRAQELSPDSPSVKVGLARVFIERKQFDQAGTALQEAEALNGENADVPLYRGVIKLAQRNYQGAVDDLSIAISRKPSSAHAHYYAGLAWNGLRKPDKMVESFQNFLKLAPGAPEAERVKSLLRSVR